jgi:hypothetical protein
MWHLNTRDNQRLEAARLNLLGHICDLQVWITKEIQQAEIIAKENPPQKKILKCRLLALYYNPCCKKNGPPRKRLNGNRWRELYIPKYPNNREVVAYKRRKRS